MPVIAGRTLLQLRQAIGHALGVVYVSSLSSIGGAAGASIVDNTLRGPDNAHNGKWIRITSGARAGDTSRVDVYTASSYTATVLPAFSTQIASAVTYEMWEEAWPPARILALINQAILEATGLSYDPEESVALFSDGRQARFDIPSQFAILTRIDYRSKVESKIIDLATTAWADAIDADVTASQDTKDYKLAPGSLKLVVVAAASAGDVLATKTITAIDISGYDYVEFWIKSTVATAAADLQLLLDNTAGAVSPLETLDVPALVANTWTFVRVALATPRLDTAIISVGLKYTVDIGAVTIWLNDIRAVGNSTGVWKPLHNRHWLIDEPNRDLVLSNAGRLQAGYHLLRLVGGDKPLLLSADGDVNEVDDQFITARAIELALLAASGGPITDPDARRQLAGYWGQKAEQAKGSFPFLVNARIIS